jgi:hypothetical protein
VKTKAVEPITYMSPYRERDQAMEKINAAIAAILQPRGGYTVGPGGKHFLRVPPVPRDKNGNECKADSPEMAAWRKEVEAVTHEEQRLVGVAQSAKGAIPQLQKWSGVIYAWEEGFETASRSGCLTDADLEDLTPMRRSHDLFIRACQCLIDRLAH